MRDALITDESVYEEAARDPEAWWAKQAEALDWFEPWDQVLDESEAPFYKWFTGGKLNASHNALDRHVDAGRGDRVAYHWRGEEGEERDVTYAELLRDVKRLANVLKERGVEPGDVVGIFLPMIPEVAVAMLACARIGAPHNVVFGGFSTGVGQGADGVLGRQGADHGRLRPAQGQGRPPSSPRWTPSSTTCPRSRPWWWFATPAPTWTCARGATSSTTRRSRRPRRTARPSRSTPSIRSSCSTPPAPPPSPRASSTPPAATSPAWPGPTSTCST